MSEPKYSSGQIVLVLDNDYPYEWRKAWLEAPKYYHKGGCYGYYYHWLTGTETDPVTRITPSSGGWKPEHGIKPLEN